MTENTYLVPKSSSKKRIFLLCCIPLERDPLPGMSRCGICGGNFEVSANWMTTHENDIFPPPIPVVCRPCFQEYKNKTFKCKKCKKNKI